MSKSPSSRERLLIAAGSLFYQQGITATGTDAVATAAGLTKPTLYAHFPSKADLVAASLVQRREEREADLTRWLHAVANARQRPLAVFDWLAAWYSSGGERGCGFLNAAAEIANSDPAARSVIKDEKVWLLDLLTRLCRSAGLRGPRQLGSQLLLLIDGVAGRVVVSGHSSARPAAMDAKRAAAALILAADTRP